MLISVLLTPILGALVISFMNNKETIKRFTLLTSVITFFLSILVWITIDISCTTYQITTISINVFVPNQSFCEFNIGVDGLSIYFVLLTTFTIPICVLASWSNITKSVKTFIIYMLILESLLICFFVVTDLLLFYVFYEAVLIPLFLIVGTWGASEPDTRRRASFLLFLYTFLGSLFILLAFLSIYNHVGTTDFKILSITCPNISFDIQKYLFLAIFFSFAIKQPLVPFHIWLNRAHAEAPLAGSIILAGLILKLATYGILRILISFLPEASMFFSPFIQVLAIFTLIYSSLTTLRQVDIKIIVAYSSVGHIALTLVGLFSNNIQGIEGGILLSLAHGLVSPALFMCIGGILYDRFHNRTITYYRGLILSIPIFSSLFFLFILGNTGTPLTINWVGEFMSVLGAMQHSPIVGILMSTGIVLSAAYSIWLYIRITGGQSSAFLNYHLDITRREFIVLLPLLFFTFLLGIFPNVVLSDIDYCVSTLISVY